MFPPQLREQPCPALDLYDLDDEFASERIRLAQLSNKCTPADLEYYINEATGIVTAGMGEEVPQRHGTADSQAKQALFFVMTKLASWKKLHDDGANKWTGPTPMAGVNSGGPAGPGFAGLHSPTGQGGLAMPPYGGQENSFGGMPQVDQGWNQGHQDFGGGPQDFRPGTAAALAAVQQMESQQGGFGGDFRPDTAAAIRAVQESGGMGPGMGGDFRPDTAAAIQAVQQQFG